MKILKNLGNLFLGLFLVALSFNIFLNPFNLVIGGVSGVAQILKNIININESVIIFVLNIILLMVSFIFLGVEKTKKTILGSFLFPILIFITAPLANLISLVNLELIVISVLGGIISGVGYGIIFKSGYTSGGTDIINQIMEKYLHIPISKSILYVDGFITFFSGAIFGLSTLFYSFISLFLLSLYSHKTIIGEGKSKTLYITSTKTKEIKKYLHNELKIDSTDFLAIGGYTNESQNMIMTVINTKDYYKIKEAIKLIDSKCFITVTDAYQLMNENITIRN